MDKTSDISLATRLLYASGAAAIGLVCVGFIVITYANHAGLELQPVQTIGGVLLASAGMFVFGLAFPETIRNYLIRFALSEGPSRYDFD